MATALWERQWLDRSAEGCSGMGAKAADGDGAVGASVAGPIGQADGRSGWVQEQPTIMAPWERRWPDQLAKGTDVLA